MHALVASEAGGIKMFDTLVDIRITAYFKNRPLDSSNICGKLYEDGLKGIIIEDDDIRYVREFTTVSAVDKENPRVVITINAVEEQ